MFDQSQKPQFDPRSPVQPARSPAPYFLAALVAAVLIWTAQQYRLEDSAAKSDRQEQSTAAPTGTEQAQEVKGDVRAVFSADDYPASAQANGEEGTAQAQLTVDESGRVSGCTIVRSSGHRSLDEATCAILTRRARFTPARDADGRAVPSTYVTPPVSWRLEG